MKQEEKKTQRRGGGNVSKDAETGKMQPQVKEGQQPPKAGKGRKWIPLLSIQRENTSADTLISDFFLPEL